MSAHLSFLEGTHDRPSSHATTAPPVLVCTADDRFAMALGVMLFSALQNSSRRRDFRIYIIDAGISAKKRKKIDAILDRFAVRRRWIAPPSEFDTELPVSIPYPSATYYRLYVPSLLPNTVRKALYIDSDIVVEGDLAELWECDIAGNYILAAPNGEHSEMESMEHLTSCPGFNVSPGAEYFNAGVLVMNLDKWRRSGVASLTIKFLRRWHAYMRFADQDGLNVIFQDNWGRLDAKWNQCIPTWEADPKIEVKAGGILHYVGWKKPWLSSATYEAARPFNNYLRASQWLGRAGWAVYALKKAFGVVTVYMARLYPFTYTKVRKGFNRIRGPAIKLPGRAGRKCLSGRSEP